VRRLIEFPFGRRYAHLMLQTPLPNPWLHDFAIPAFFTLFGAALGFALSEYRDYCRAKRDKVAFINSVATELDALNAQLLSSLLEIQSSTARVKGNGDSAPQFAATMRTLVFTSQLSKLRNIDDPLLLKIVRFYSDLGTLQQIWELVNDQCAQFNRADISSGERDRIKPRVMSGLQVLEERLSSTISEIRKLRTQFPGQQS
jgi:hypothetical protein